MVGEQKKYKRIVRIKSNKAKSHSIVEKPDSVGDGTSKDVVANSNTEAQGKEIVGTIPSPYHSVCANPLDRYCDMLLRWNFHVDISDYENKQNKEHVPRLPYAFKTIGDTFPEGYSTYLRVFEPLMMEEIRCSILSKCSGKPYTSLLKGTSYLKQESVSTTTMPVIKVAISGVKWFPVNAKASLRVMDFILISFDTQKHPAESYIYQPNTSLKQVTAGGQYGDLSGYILGVVTSKGSNGKGSMQVHVSRAKWDAYLTARAIRVNAKREEKGMSTSNSTSANASVVTSVNIIVLEQLTSHWREFQALHMIHYAPLLSHTLLGSGVGSRAVGNGVVGDTDRNCENRNIDFIDGIGSVPCVSAGAEIDARNCPNSIPVNTAPNSSDSAHIQPIVRHRSNTPPMWEGQRSPDFSDDEDSPPPPPPPLPVPSPTVGKSAKTPILLDLDAISCSAREKPNAPSFSPIVSPPKPPVSPSSNMLDLKVQSQPSDSSIEIKTELGVVKSETMTTVPDTKTVSDTVEKRTASEDAVLGGSFGRILKSKYNKSQLRAIESAMEDDAKGFVLIQGPPGTGKTHTVIGLLNTLHLKEYNRFYGQSIEWVLGTRGLQCRAATTVVQTKTGTTMTPASISNWMELISEVSTRSKPHILVTAPSNVAIDNIATRIMEKGFIDGNGCQYFPSLLRIRAAAGDKTLDKSNSASGIDVPDIVSDDAKRRGPSIGESAGSTRENRLKVKTVRNNAVAPISLEEATEQLLCTSRQHRAKQLSKLQEFISLHLSKLYHVQTVLILMRSAYCLYCKALYPGIALNDALISSRCSLPVGVELRFDMRHNKPYWVDHITKKTTERPPPVNTLKRIKTVDDCLYGSFTSLPEYVMNSHSLSNLVDQLVLANIQAKRYQYIQNHICNSNGSDSGLNGANEVTTEQFSAKDMYDLRSTIESSVIDESHIVLTTLNSTGSSVLDSSQFNVIVVDEAAQCVEPSVLIPVSKLKCNRVILVGDPKQLPATLFSNTIKKYNYDRSLLERLMDGGHPYTMLDTQYRMLPAIAAFPSTMFYNSCLRNGSNVCKQSYSPKYIRQRVEVNTGSSLVDSISTEQSSSTSIPREASMDTSMDTSMEMEEVDQARLNMNINAKIHHQDLGVRRVTASSVQHEPRFPPFLFIDVKSSNDDSLVSSRACNASKSNPEEAKMCLELLKCLLQEVASVGDFSIGHIGVITPYSEQVNECVALFTERGYMMGDGLTSVAIPVNIQERCSDEVVIRGKNQSKATGSRKVSTYITIESIEFNTVDGFQGKEKDIVLISCVRANDESNIGFLSDIRRMNVALTRGRFGVYVVGHRDTLIANKHWNLLIRHAVDTHALVSVANADESLLDALDVQLYNKVLSSSNDSSCSNSLRQESGETRSLIQKLAEKYTSIRDNLPHRSVNSSNDSRSGLGAHANATVMGTGRESGVVSEMEEGEISDTGLNKNKTKNGEGEEPLKGNVMRNMMPCKGTAALVTIKQTNPNSAYPSAVTEIDMKDSLPSPSRTTITKSSINSKLTTDIYDTNRLPTLPSKPKPTPNSILKIQHDSKAINRKGNTVHKQNHSMNAPPNAQSSGNSANSQSKSSLSITGAIKLLDTDTPNRTKNAECKKLIRTDGSDPSNLDGSMNTLPYKSTGSSQMELKRKHHDISKNIKSLRKGNGTIKVAEVNNGKRGVTPMEF